MSICSAIIENIDNSRLKMSLDKAEEIILYAKGKGKLISKLAKKSLTLIPYGIVPIKVINTPFQEIVLAKYKGRIALFQDGEWQFLSGKDAEGEFHKHEAFIPAKLINKESPEVLIIGGGDGLAARDVLKAKSNAKITLVDIDKDMINFAKTNKIMRKLNKGSLDKVKAVAADGIEYLLTTNKKYDLIIVDLPDPIRYTTYHLYDRPLIIGILNALKENGIVSIYATSHNSPLQIYLENELKPYFRITKRVSATVKEMGTAGFVYGISKKNTIIKPKTLKKMLRQHKEALED